LNICSSDNATAFSARLTSCIVTAVKDVFWGFVYGEKLDQEKKEQDQSTGGEDREQRQSGEEDLVSVYRMGSSALFRIKKSHGRKLSSNPGERN